VGAVTLHQHCHKFQAQTGKKDVVKVLPILVKIFEGAKWLQFLTSNYSTSHQLGRNPITDF
jgi:hypothetical protein